MANIRKYESGQIIGNFTLIKTRSEMTQEDIENTKGVNPKAKGWMLRCNFCNKYILSEISRVTNGYLKSCGCQKGKHIAEFRDHSVAAKKNKISYAKKSSEEKEELRKLNSERQKLVYSKKDKSTFSTVFSSPKFIQDKQNKAISYTVIETGETLSAWIKRTNPIASLSVFVRAVKEFPNKQVPESFLFNVNEDAKNKKSYVEKMAEKLFEIEKYTKQAKPGLNFRPDFKIGDIYIDVDGLYIHSEAVTEDSKYHFRKRVAYEEYGLRLLQFRENELRDKPLIVKSILNNVLGKTPNKIYARKCEIKTVSFLDAAVFFNQTHLMGTSFGFKALGLYYNNELVSCLGYKEVEEGILDITRFSNKLDTSVVGGLSRLITEVERQNPEATKLKYWVDLRYATGRAVENLEFEIDGKDRDGGFSWTDGKNTFSRQSILKEANKNKKWYRIYDAGQRLFIKKLK